MKKLRELKRNMASIRILILNIFLAVPFISILVSCSNNIDITNALEDKENKASMTSKNSEVIYTENGKVKLKVLAPVTNFFQSKEDPRTEFPEGITVYTFSDSMEIESELTAKYAIYYDKNGLWSASNNVVAKNSKGETLNTEHLYWDQNKKIIYTDDQVKITTADVVQYGQGFQSDEQFNKWEIKNAVSYYDLEQKEPNKQ